jgi:hypothetical protein
VSDQTDGGEFGLHTNWENCEGGLCCNEALVIMHALVVERDEANVQWHKIRDLHASAITDLRAAEARITELEAALAKCPPDCLANLDAIPTV